MNRLVKERYVLHKGIQLKIKATDPEVSEECRVNTKLRAKGYEMSNYDWQYVITKRSPASTPLDGFEPIVELIIDITSKRIQRRPKASRSLKYLQGLL